MANTEYCNECENVGCKDMRNMQKTRQAFESVARLSTAYFSYTLKCDYYKLDKDKLPTKEGCTDGQA